MVNRFVDEHPVPPEHTGALTRLLDLVRPYMTSAEIQQVISAFQLAVQTYERYYTDRSPAPLPHALAVTTILAQEMHVDAIGIAAGLVFEAVDAEALELDEVERLLGAPVARVVGSMWRLNILERKKQSITDTSMLAIQPASSFKDELVSSNGLESKKPRIREAMRRQQSETVRKMFVAMADDPRVVLLKLAYRLNAMRLICASHYKSDAQDMLTMAEETREIYAPLAGRLGMSRVESELDDLAFQVLEPEEYSWIRDIVESESKQWRSYVERVCTILRSEMASINVTCEVSGRVKHYYSFYKKIVRTTGEVNGIEELKAIADLNQIHDLIAFRILVDTTSDCYVALGHVHSLWKPKEGRIKDFIANPKPNGYSALHTTVFCLDNQLVEIQIRTHAMHEMAEYGVAMHWHYKDVGDTASASAKELLTWLRQMAEWQHEIRSSNTSDTDFVEAVKDDILQEQIFVFTPKGEVKDLPVGSTPVDFAYRIHSKVGDTCAGARIITQVESGDGDRLVTKMVPLDYLLKNGDVVDIVTNRTAHPSRDWLTFARTATAKGRIRRYLKQHERVINVQIGTERLDRDIKNACGRSVEQISEDAERWLCEDYHLDSLEDILAAIGADDIRPRAVVTRLLEYWQQREGKDLRDSREGGELLPLPTSTKQQSTAQLEVAGVSGLLTRLANCCCPLPGDDITGFISRGKGVIVHRSDCQNIARFRNHEQERLINVRWGSMNQPRYLAPIIITARDRPGLLRDIATVISDVGMNLVSINTHVQNSGKALITATLEIYQLEQIQRLFGRLERVRGILHAERDMGRHR